MSYIYYQGYSKIEAIIVLKSKEMTTKAISSGGDISMTESLQPDSQNVIIG